MLRTPIAACLLFSTTLVPVAASAMETSARAAMAVDHATGMVLLKKNEDMPLPTASMSKLMTLYMLFEAIRDGRVTTETEFRVSKRAQAMGGSRMFVEAETTVPVDALIHGIIVQSGNDACVVVAENLAGTEEEFSRQMTERAREIGLENTVLKNSSGWPEEGHVMSSEDLVELARRIISEFPEYYRYFAETEYTWNGITQGNRNPLLNLGIGADGLKTGHTEDAGYGLVGSAVQDGQRIVFVLAGLGSVSERAAEAEAVVSWAFNAFEPVRFYDAGAQATVADVWLGAQETVPVVAPGPIQMLVPRGGRDEIAARIVYQGPIEAPIQAGQKVAELVVEVPGQDGPVHFDLVAGQAVERGGLVTRIGAAATLTRNRALQFLPSRN
jgi:serine-type D-Ala-D-Ala carboxypeptidase (penicillin-binding protein 5/6)